MRITVVWRNEQNVKLLRELKLWFFMSFHDYQKLFEGKFEFVILVFAITIYLSLSNLFILIYFLQVSDQQVSEM